MIEITTLIGHILFGLIGVLMSVAIVLSLVGKLYNRTYTLYSSIAAFSSFMASWLLGGWYYVTYYGSVVKPIIKSGPYPWAHLIVMESKEHIFLMLPILTAVIMLFVWLNKDKPKSMIPLAILNAVLAVFILMTGVVISGGVQ